MHEVTIKVTLATDQFQGRDDARYLAIQALLETDLPEPLVHHLEIIQGLVDRDGVPIN